MALLLGLAMLPAGAIAAQVGFNAIAAREAAHVETLSRRALQSISAEAGVVEEIREMMRVLATTPQLQQIESGDCGEWLSEVALRYPYVAAIAVTDESSRVLCSYPTAAPNLRAEETDLRRRARSRDAFTMGYIERGGITHQPVLGALEPIRSGNRRVGFVGASITVQQLHEVLNRGRELDGARAAIVDSSGRIIAQSDPLPDQPDVGLPTAEQIRNHLGSGPQFVEVRNGDAVVLPLHPPDLYAVMSWAPEQPAWRTALEGAVTLAAPLLIWLLAVAAGWFAIEVFVARPLSSLEQAARGFARGEEMEDPPALRNAPEEIRTLRRTLAAMAKTLRGRELRLVEALAEERALLREVHHRVKNNLQMVASLLNIQARAARDESESWGLARAHDRVQLLALVHQRIYASGELRELRMDDLSAEIARQLLQSRGGQARGVQLVLNLSPARADADRAVPLAFLMGEGVSVALDSLAEQSAELRLYLQQDEDGETRFAVDSDASDVSPILGPGARLIEAFARQLGASVGRDPEHPFRLWVVVPRPAPIAVD